MKIGLYILTIVINYLLGSIPFAYIVTKKVIGKDIREIGSGNVGATNVYRSCVPLWGVIVFILDALKGYLAAFISGLIIDKKFDIPLSDFTIDHEVVLLTTLFFAVLGHLYPVFLGFHGGKGVAVSSGIFIALTPKPMEITMVIWALVTSISRYVSLGSLVASFFFPILTYWFGYSKVMVGFSTVISLFIFIRHIPNIGRIIRGEELRIGERV